MDAEIVLGKAERSNPWRACLELAWEALQAGSVPVGAVVVDGEGRIVSRGRSRAGERDGPVGQLRGTFLAHAEVNALAALMPGRYLEYTLYTSLQPCLLCSAAAMQAGVGTVRYAGVDPLWDGIERLPELNAHVARRWPRRSGPLEGPIAIWATLVPLTLAVRLDPAGPVVASLERTVPKVVALARTVVQSGEFDSLSGGSMQKAASSLWGRIEECVGGD